MPEDRGTQRGSHTDEDKILIEFRRNEVLHAITIVSDFSKSMITLTSGFFVAYFALLKFLGLGENITESDDTIAAIAGIPPVIFIISIILFIISYAPPILKADVPINNLAEIINYRMILLRRKRITMFAGLTMFVIGLAVTLNICLRILF